MENQKDRQNNEEYIDLLEYWHLIVQHRRFIGIATVAAFVLSVIISLVLPKTYLAKASVLPPQQDNPASALLQSTALGSLAGGILGSQSQSDLWVGILNSQTVQDAVIARFGLRELYSTENIEDTRKALARNVAIEKSQEEIISIGVEDEDPKRAADMANAFAEELDKISMGSATTSGQRVRIFVEKRLKEAKADFFKVEEDIRAFQEKYGVVKIDDQSKVIIESIGELKGQIIAKEVQLQTLLSYATPTNPQAQLLKTELSELRFKFRELEKGPSSNGIFIPTARLPEISINYARLFREAKVQETLFELLTQQYELARMQEAKDTPTVQFLDYAKPPEKKSKPKRVIIVLAGTFFAFLGSIGYVMVKKLLKLQ